MSVFRKILRTYYKGMTPFHSVWLSNFQSVLMSRSKAVDQRCSVKKVFLEFSQNSQEKHLCQSLFNKVAGLLKRRIEHRCFPVNFAKFLRTPFFIEYLWWLLLLLLKYIMHFFVDRFWLKTSIKSSEKNFKL